MKRLIHGKAWLTAGLVTVLAGFHGVHAEEPALDWDGSAKDGAPAPAVTAAAAQTPAASPTLEAYVLHKEKLAKALSSAAPEKVGGLFQLSNPECRDAEAKALEAKIEPLFSGVEAPGLDEAKTAEERGRLKDLIKRAQVAHAAAVAALSRQLDKAADSAQAKATVAEMREHNHRVAHFGRWLFSMSLK